MTDALDKDESETTPITTAAESDVNSASEPNSLTDEARAQLQQVQNQTTQQDSQATEPSRRQGRSRRSRQGSRRRNESWRELYADNSVPRVVYERRQGSSAHSRAYLKKALCLYSDRAQVFFENNYERVNTNLIISTLVVEAIGGEKFALQVSELLENKFSELETELTRAVDELKRIAREKGIPEDCQVPSYDHKRHYEPPLHTPHSIRFLDLVSLFDRFVARVEGAWINKVICSQTRKTLISTWEKRLVKFVQELHKLRNDSMETARGAGFGPRAKAIADQIRNEQHATLVQEDVQTNNADDTPEK